MPAPAAVPPMVFAAGAVHDDAIAEGEQRAVPGRSQAHEVPLDQVPRGTGHQEDVLVAVGGDDVAGVRRGPADRVAAGAVDQDALIVPLRGVARGVDADEVARDDVTAAATKQVDPILEVDDIEAPNDAVAGRQREAVGEAAGPLRTTSRTALSLVADCVRRGPRLGIAVDHHAVRDRGQRRRRRDRERTGPRDVELDLHRVGTGRAIGLADRPSERAGPRVVGVRHDEGDRVHIDRDGGDVRLRLTLSIDIGEAVGSADSRRPARR